MDSTNRDLVVRFYKEVILDGHLDRATDFLRTDYIQHNPRAGQGLRGFVAFFERIKKSLDAQGATRRSEIIMALSDGDLVTVYVTNVVAGWTEASFRALISFV